MSPCWYLYTSVAPAAARAAVTAMYAQLSAIVGEDLAEHLEPGEELEPPTLGCWPEVEVASSPVPKADEARVALGDPKKKVRFEEAALERLGTCVSTLAIERSKGLGDPALVTGLRALVEALGPCVFTQGKGFGLVTSETLLKDLAAATDLSGAMRALAAKDEEADEDEEEEEDEDEEEDEEEDEDEDEPASDSARPEVLRGILAAMAGIPRARRKAGELMANAPELVARVAERLARVGAEPDAAVATALAATEADVAKARRALATILRRAEDR